MLLCDASRSLAFARALCSSLLFLIAFLVAGCSGGGSSSDPSPSEPPASPASPPSPAPPDLISVASFEGGTLYQTTGAGGAGVFKVLLLKGDWRQMGRQYGYLAGEQMAQFYNLAAAYLTRTRRWSYEDLRRLGQYAYDLQFAYARQLIEGMAETSGMSMERQRIVASLMGGLFGCSSMDAWGDYTGGGPLVVGRNWDTVRGPFDGYGRFLTVVVYHPPAPQRSVADINYVGSISMQTGMNDAGLFLDLQNGEMSDPRTYERTPGSFQLFSFLLNCTRADELEASFRTTPANMGLIINTAAANPVGRDHPASVYEWATYDVKQRTGDGLLASSNHYIDPSWRGLRPVPPGPAGGFSRERLQNLLDRGQQYKGSIDAQRMMQIFDTTLPAGGPTFPDDSPLETYYQIVATPADRILWLKARGYSGWEKIPLGPLFE